MQRMHRRTISSYLALALVVAGAGPAAVVDWQRELSGIVLGPDGEPVAGCRATIGEGSALTDERGRFRLEDPETPEAEPVLVLDAPRLAVKRIGLPGLPRQGSFDLGVFELGRGSEVRGTVVDPAGAPLPGARVLLVTPEGHAETLTGPEGRFRFSGVEPGRYDLGVAAAGFPIAAERGLSVRGPVTLEPLALGPGIEVTGEIEDATGAPVAGVWVRVSHDSSVPYFLARIDDPPAPRARTGIDGRFRLRGLRAESDVTLGVEIGGVMIYSLHRLRVPATSDPFDVGALTLGTGRSVSGRVVDPAGEPIPGARIIPRYKGLAGASGMQSVIEAGPDGVFRAPAMRAGEHLLDVSALGFRTRESLELKVDGGLGTGAPEPYLEIVLQPVPSGALHIAVDPHPGAGLPPGLEVRVEGLSGNVEEVNDVRPLDERGRAHWERLPVGRYLVSVVGERPLYRERQEIGEGSSEVVITLPQPEPAADVAGRLLGPDAEPVAFARLWFYPADRPGASRSALSDGRGRWRAELPPGVYRLSTEHPGYVPLGLPDVKVELGTRELGPWRLERGLELRGGVSGLTPNEASRLEVHASSPELRQVAAEIEPGGRFRLATLTPGDWSVQARISGTSLEATARVSLGAGGPPREVVLDFPPAVGASGRVTDHGVPLAGAHIWASPHRDSPGPDASATTDADGRFQLSGMPPGTYDLRVSVRPVGRIHRRRVVLPADSEIEIALQTGSVAGRVVRADDGSPIPSAWVRFVAVGHDRPDENGEVVYISHERFAGVQTDAGGRLAVERLEEGRWRLEASAEGFVPGTAELTIADGNAVEDLTMELVPTPGLELSVATELGAIRYGVRAQLRDSEGAVVAETAIGEHEADRIVWKQAPPGEWSLTVHSQVMGTRVTLPVAVPGPPIDVVLPSVGKLHLTVAELLEDDAKAELTLLDAAGDPAEAGGRCCARTDRWPISKTRRFYVWGVEPGFYQVLVEAGDGRSWSHWVAIDADVITEVTLD